MTRDRSRPLAVVSSAARMLASDDDLNNRITADDRVDSVMALVADGLTLVRRR
jgi:hypothetical protein